MGHFKVLTSFNIELDFEIAEFHKRLFAWMIDAVIVVIYFIIASNVFSSIATGMSDRDGTDIWAIGLLMLLPASLYPLITEITMNGQTVGKKLMGIKIVNEMGGNATLSQFIIRWMLRSSDLFMILVIFAVLAREVSLLKALGFSFCLLVTDIICVVATKKSQRLGDIAAGTLLINARTRTNLEQTVFVQTEEDYKPTYPEVMKLSDRDMNIIKTVLDNIAKRKDWSLADRTASKVQSALNIEPKHDAVTFLETLLKDYNHISTN